MTMVDGERGRDMETWKAAVNKGIICEVKELNDDILHFADTDEGSMLEGLWKMGEVGILAVLRRIWRWCKKIHNSIPGIL